MTPTIVHTPANSLPSHLRIAPRSVWQNRWSRIHVRCAKNANFSQTDYHLQHRLFSKSPHFATRSKAFTQTLKAMPEGKNNPLRYREEETSNYLRTLSFRGINLLWRCVSSGERRTKRPRYSLLVRGIPLAIPRLIPSCSSEKARNPSEKKLFSPVNQKSIHSYFFKKVGYFYLVFEEF